VIFFPSYIQITISLHNNNSTFSHASILWSCKAMERAHVTSKFVHLVCKVNIVSLTPISEWKNVLNKEKYDECIKKAKKDLVQFDRPCHDKFFVPIKITHFKFYFMNTMYSLYSFIYILNFHLFSHTLSSSIFHFHMLINILFPCLLVKLLPIVNPSLGDEFLTQLKLHWSCATTRVDPQEKVEWL
jgi:hypothetical protein